MIPSSVHRAQKSNPPNARYAAYVKIASIEGEVFAGRYATMSEAESVTACLLTETGVTGTRILPISGADMYPLEG